MQENHGLYANRIEPIHLMTKVTSVLCTIYKKEKYNLIKQLADNLILTIDENITPEDIINFFVIIGTNYIKENSDMTLSNMTCNQNENDYNI